MQGSLRPVYPVRCSNRFLQAHSMSGRALRRLPVLALARYIGIGQISSSNPDGRNTGADVEIWLQGMETVVQEKVIELEKLVSC